MIDELVEDLKRDEGFVPHVYNDHLGYATLGFGFLVDERRGGGIPMPIAQEWLKYEIRHRRQQLTLRWPDFLSQPSDVQRGLLNMAYQLGIDGLLAFRKMLEALEQGDRNRAADEALRSRWASQTPERAERVSALIRGSV